MISGTREVRCLVGRVCGAVFFMRDSRADETARRMVATWQPCGKLDNQDDTSFLLGLQVLLRFDGVSCKAFGLVK